MLKYGIRTSRGWVAKENQGIFRFKEDPVYPFTDLETTQQLTMKWFSKDRVMEVVKKPRWRRQVVLYSLAVLLLGGCAPGKWYKSGATVQSFEMDKAQCEYDATLVGYTPSSGGYYRTYGQAAAAGFIQGIEQGLRRLEIMKACLRARGYEFKYDSQ